MKAKAESIYAKITSYANYSQMNGIEREWFIKCIEEGLIEVQNEFKNLGLSVVGRSFSSGQKITDAKEVHLKLSSITETYRIIDSQGNEVLTDVSVSLFDFIDDVDNMLLLYRRSRYSDAEEMRDELAVKLDDVMRGYYKKNNY